MKRITEEEHLKYFKKLVELGVLEQAENGKFVHVHHEWNKKGSLERIKNLKLGPHCVWVVGYPKTGSHFVQVEFKIPDFYIKINHINSF